MENGTMTSSFKLARPVLTLQYRPIFNQLAKNTEEHFRQLQDSSCNSFAHIVGEVLGLGFETIDQSVTFGQLGGDSLSAVQMITTLQDRWGVTVPSDWFFDKTMSISQLSTKVEELRFTDQQQPQPEQLQEGSQSNSISFLNLSSSGRIVLDQGSSSSSSSGSSSFNSSSSADSSDGSLLRESADVGMISEEAINAKSSFEDVVQKMLKDSEISEDILNESIIHGEELELGKNTFITGKIINKQNNKASMHE